MPLRPWEFLVSWCQRLLSWHEVVAAARANALGNVGLVRALASIDTKLSMLFEGFTDCL